jgi:hypothetical protein
MVYVKKAVDLDGRVTNVLKVFNNAYNIVMFYGAYNNNCISPYSCVHIAPENMLKIIEII